MKTTKIDRLRARIAALDNEIAAATALRRRLEVELHDRRIVEHLAETGEKFSVKAKRYVFFRELISLFLQNCYPKGLSPSEILEKIESMNHQVNPHTLRSYLLRMRSENRAVNNHGQWTLLEQEKADESANSRLPSAT